MGHRPASAAVELTLDTNASRLVVEFQTRIEEDLRLGGQLAHLRDWGGKLAGTTLRIAGLLHLAANAELDIVPTETTVETMKAALDIGDYLVLHAIATFDLMGTELEVEDARRILTWVTEKRLMAFSAREAFQDLKGTFHKMPPLKEVIDLLVSHHYLYQQPPSRTGKPGRPASPLLNVNPWVFG